MEFQKLKLELRSPLINGVNVPKGEKENDTDFWNVFVSDTHGERLKKANEIGDKVTAVLK